MRPSSRRRVAAWLLALPMGRGGEECARRGRLEMISFWLLCWKLLRATAGLRRTTAELTDGNHDNSNSSNSNPVNSSPTPTQLREPVTMETSSLLPPTEKDTDDLVGCCNQEAEEPCYPEDCGAQGPITDEHEGAEAGDGEERQRDRECNEDYLFFEIKGEEIGREGGGQSEGPQDTEGGQEEEKDRESRETYRIEDGGKAETEGENGGKGERGREDRMEDGGSGETEGEDGVKGETEGEDGIKGGEKGETKGEGGFKDGQRGETAGETEKVPLVSLGIPVCPLAGQHQVAGSNPSQQPTAAMLEEGWCREQGGRDDLSDGHLSDCLQAELAIVSSDSDAGEDQWLATMPCDVAKQEDTSERIQDGICDGERKVEKERRVEEEMRGEREEEEGREEEAEIGMEEQTEEERRGDRDDADDEDQTRPGSDLFLRSSSVSSSVNSTDPDRRVPADFCVHEETRSENVSTEHLDFLLARQQWKKMEQEVKGQPLPQPGLRSQGSFQGTHSSLYPPTRSPRLKHREVYFQPPREPPLSSTMSPSSEDSGLDDSSYRSPLEEPESAVEREIRLTLEREERHRRERGMLAQGLAIPRPVSLQTGRSPPRPPACRTPTLSISPSPSSSSSLPRSVYHEMTANNVIILEPDSSHSASRTRLLSPGGLCDWPGGLDAVPAANVIVVETSNLIFRSASEFCLSSTPVCVETQESTFSSNPFFKLRSLSSQSLVEQEIRMVRQREEEWRKQREEEWRRRREEEWRRGRERERYDTVLVSPGLNDNISYNVSEVPDRCVSSPSSPSRTRKMERSSLSCDHKLEAD